MLHMTSKMTGCILTSIESVAKNIMLSSIELLLRSGNQVTVRRNFKYKLYELQGTGYSLTYTVQLSVNRASIK